MEWVGYLRAKLEELERIANEVKSREVEKIAKEVEKIVVETCKKILGIDKADSDDWVEDGIEFVEYKCIERDRKLYIKINRTALRKALHKIITAKNEHSIRIRIEERNGDLIFEVYDYLSVTTIIEARLTFY